MEKTLQPKILASQIPPQSAGGEEIDPFAFEDTLGKGPKRAVQVLEKGTVGGGRALKLG